MRNATVLDETFEPRPGLEPEKLQDVSTARVLFHREVAPWRIERGARPLADGTALEELRFGSEDWLVGEILAHRGMAVVLEPRELRTRIRARAQELAKTIVPARSRARARS